MWIKVDDGFISHPKVLAAAEMLGPYGLGRAVAGWLTGVTYAGAHQTDGFIPTRIIAQMDDPQAKVVAKVLVQAGLWEAVDGGFRIHDYHDYNPKAEKVIAAKKAHLQRQQAYLAKRLDRQAAKRDAVNDAPVDAVNDALPVPVPVPIPSKKRDAPSLPPDFDDPTVQTPEMEIWQAWREEWDAAYADPLPLTPRGRDRDNVMLAAKKSRPLPWVRLMIRAYLQTKDKAVEESPRTIGWMLRRWSWVEHRLAEKGYTPDKVAA